ncbi:acyl carrier protein [Vibrio lentus]|uniref:acyl carrier protein n=1 Tax=Vibrio lentus TaxID=136468 RepID=UPI000C820F9E|nr:acyl carrier protein [Vibrio lentus]PMG78020.1 hypothetical protein BCU86_21110 [Vibrio lentus]
METNVSVNVEEISLELKTIILKILNLKFDQNLINSNTDLLDLGLASIQMVDLLSDIENTFNITLDVEDVSVYIFTSYQNMLNFVLSNLGK